LRADDRKEQQPGNFAHIVELRYDHADAVTGRARKAVTSRRSDDQLHRPPRVPKHPTQLHKLDTKTTTYENQCMLHHTDVHTNPAVTHPYSLLSFPAYPPVQISKAQPPQRATEEKKSGWRYYTGIAVTKQAPHPWNSPCVSSCGLVPPRLGDYPVC
jgi:hypothetical protein